MFINRSSSLNLESYFTWISHSCKKFHGATNQPTETFNRGIPYASRHAHNSRRLWEYSCETFHTNRYSQHMASFVQNQLDFHFPLDSFFLRYVVCLNKRRRSWEKIALIWIYWLEDDLKSGCPFEGMCCLHSKWQGDSEMWDRKDFVITCHYTWSADLPNLNGQSRFWGSQWPNHLSLS